MLKRSHGSQELGSWPVAVMMILSSSGHKKRMIGNALPLLMDMNLLSGGLISLKTENTWHQQVMILLSRFGNKEITLNKILLILLSALYKVTIKEPSILALGIMMEHS